MVAEVVVEQKEKCETGLAPLTVAAALPGQRAPWFL